MSNVVQIFDEQNMKEAIMGRRARNAIGGALARAYPTHPWMVSVTADATVATITCPKLSTRYGMTLHCTRETQDLERKAVQMAGELLERFKVSRSVGEFGHVQRNIAGEAAGVSTGEAISW